jgi:hypothetical protein
MPLMIVLPAGRGCGDHLKWIGSEFRARDDHPIGGYVARVGVLGFRNYFADLEVADL